MIFEKYYSFQDILIKFRCNDHKIFLEKHCRKDEWADEIMILAASLMSNRPIIALSTTIKDVMYFLNFGKENSIEYLSRSEPLLISFCSYHYSALMNIPKKKFNFVKYFYSSDNGFELNLVSL